MKVHSVCILRFAFTAASALLLNASQAGERITFVSQGGAYQQAQRVAILGPVSKALGITVKEDSAPDAWPIIKTQESTGKVVWDVVDTPAVNCIRGGEQNLIAKLDFSKIPNAASMPAEYKTPYSVAYEFYSSVLAYNPDKYSRKTPSSWADFWDMKNFPGRRALRNHPLATLEAALLADGVPRDKLYPLDVDRAFRKLEQIKPYVTVWWTSGGQSAQLLHDGEVDMAMMWNGRASALQKDGNKVAYTYNDGILQNTHLCALKNAPNANGVTAFINAAIAPEFQANLPLQIDYGPGNPAAFTTGKISANRAEELPNSPANVGKQTLMSYAWWTSPEGEKAEKRWLEFMQK
jgi:putative spermidine/putrescine transport system substrate-binding protein